MTLSPPIYLKDLPSFKAIHPATISSRISQLIEKNKQILKEVLAQQDTYTWDKLMQPIEVMNDELSKTWSPINHLHGVRESEELRQAYNKTLPLIIAYHTEISQNEALFKAIATLTKSTELETFN